MSYKVFHRTFWKRNPSWPGGREPAFGRKITIRKNVPTIDQARDICRVWNANHPEGLTADRAEFTET